MWRWQCGVVATPDNLIYNFWNKEAYIFELGRLDGGLGDDTKPITFAFSKNAGCLEFGFEFLLFFTEDVAGLNLTKFWR